MGVWIVRSCDCTAEQQRSVLARRNEGREIRVKDGWKEACRRCLEEILGETLRLFLVRFIHSRMFQRIILKYEPAAALVLILLGVVVEFHEKKFHVCYY
jgi:hypothetical protein